MSCAEEAPTVAPAAVPPSSLADTKIYRSIVHFTVNKVELKLTAPWKTGKTSDSTATGFYIGNKRIVTNCHVVNNAASVRLERNGKPGTFKGIVLFISPMCDLAIVTVENDSFWDGLEYVEVDDEIPHLGEAVLAVGYPKGNKTVTVTRGVVSTVCLKDLSLLGMNPRLVCIQIDAAINPGNSGGPVIGVDSKKLVGVAFSHLRNAQLMCFIISAPVLRMFMSEYERVTIQNSFTRSIASNSVENEEGEDSMKSNDNSSSSSRNNTRVTNYGCLPEVGFYCDELKNVSLRKRFFGSKFHVDDFFGCLIMCVREFTPVTDVLKVDDVLLAVDGHPVSENGEVHFRNHEWLHFDWLISKKEFGSTVQFKILRKNEDAPNEIRELTVEVPIKRVKHLIPKILGVDFEPYWVVLGGLVFVKVSVPLIVQLGKDGDILKKYSSSVMKYEDEDIIVVVDVLSHFVNNSYRKYKWCRLMELNGAIVRSMEHLARMLHVLLDRNGTVETVAATSLHETPRDCDGFLELDFLRRPESMERRVAVFEIDEIKNTEEEILDKHKISSWCSPELLEGNKNENTI